MQIPSTYRAGVGTSEANINYYVEPNKAYMMDTTELAASVNIEQVKQKPTRNILGSVNIEQVKNKNPRVKPLSTAHCVQCTPQCTHVRCHYFSNLRSAISTPLAFTQYCRRYGGPHSISTTLTMSDLAS